MKIKVYNKEECKDVFYNCESFDIIKFQCLRKEECVNLKRCFRMLMVMTRKPRRWLKEYKYVKEQNKNIPKGISIRERSPSFISPEPFRMTLKDVDDKGIFWKKKESNDNEYKD